MANRRDLKKSIGYIAGDLITECLIRYNFVPGTDLTLMDECISELIEIDAEFVRRVSHTQPGEAKKYYRALYNDFNDRIAQVVAKIDAAAEKKK